MLDVGKLAFARTKYQVYTRVSGISMIHQAVGARRHCYIYTLLYIYSQIPLLQVLPECLIPGKYDARTIIYRYIAYVCGIAVLLWEQTTSSLNGVSPKRDCGSNRVSPEPRVRVKNTTLTPILTWHGMVRRTIKILEVSSTKRFEVGRFFQRNKNTSYHECMFHVSSTHVCM